MRQTATNLCVWSSTKKSCSFANILGLRPWIHNYAGFVNRASGSSAKHPAAEHSTVCCVPARGPRPEHSTVCCVPVGPPGRNAAHCGVFRRSRAGTQHTLQCSAAGLGRLCSATGGSHYQASGTLKEPRTTAMATSTTTTSVGPRGAPVVLPWCSRFFGRFRRFGAL